ncbi:uncharacterized protein MELLADRAFT_56835 [Melampsora larici-populina 98AG31]|uniref:Uncharacterized protein n=1 Tax=Melampsora larici-populina (strain 98AG31 / pathotype 3-4-7) TaxID=747676 RepID=F4RV00_MELLP|nr:uncharacterized protein MELLADRAFT_56835 [Melampsora larici-populina 98AG31]EGG03836.1 hypothetical protein MELLADRAFT_56835 [Melampsora larici-populina 98AG31]
MSILQGSQFPHTNVGYMSERMILRNPLGRFLTQRFEILKLPNLVMKKVKVCRSSGEFL